jgi:hypothetical protein
MENEPILKNEKMNINKLITKDYINSGPIGQKKTNPFQGSLLLPLTIVLLCVPCAIGILVTQWSLWQIIAFAVAFLRVLVPLWQMFSIGLLGFE